MFRMSPGMLRLFLLLGLASVLTGCFHAGYLAQAALGQDDILYRSRPIDEVLRDPLVGPRTHAALRRVRHAKRFGERHGLKPTASYDHYADLKRPAAVWVVSACAPLSFDVTTWSFPIVGSVPYLGWFARQDALAHADRLEKKGLDVSVRPARAYSTLGWFDDPVLSTMLGDDDPFFGALVEVVLHESVHATLYVPSQSRFNESLATRVGQVLTEEFLRQHVSEDAAARFVREEMLSSERRSRMVRAYRALDSLYRSAATDAEKYKRKAFLIDALHRDLNLFRRPNNATLAQWGTYQGGSEAIDALVERCGSIANTMHALQGIGPKDFSSPQQTNLAPVLARFCSSGSAIGQ